MDEELEEEKPWDSELKPKERLFLLELTTSEENFLKAGPAYREVYVKKDKETKELVYLDEDSANSSASRLLRKPRVKTALKKLLELTQSDRDEANVYETLKTIETLAFYNPADIIDREGRLIKSLEDLGPLAKCVAQIRQTKYGPEVILADRFKYMEMLGKYLNIVRPEVQQEVRLAVVEVPPKITGETAIEAADAWNAIAAKEN